MFFNFYLFFYFMFFCGLFVFCSVRNHLLLTLLSLEYLVVVLFFFFFFYLFGLKGDFFFLFFFLIFCVCEGVLGLSVLVSLIRCHGNDMVKSLSCLW